MDDLTQDSVKLSNKEIENDNSDSQSLIDMPSSIIHKELSSENLPEGRLDSNINDSRPNGLEADFGEHGKSDPTFNSNLSESPPKFQSGRDPDVVMTEIECVTRSIITNSKSQDGQNNNNSASSGETKCDLTVTNENEIGAVDNSSNDISNVEYNSSNLSGNLLVSQGDFTENNGTLNNLENNDGFCEPLEVSSQTSADNTNIDKSSSAHNDEESMEIDTAIECTDSVLVNESLQKSAVPEDSWKDRDKDVEPSSNLEAVSNLETNSTSEVSLRSPESIEDSSTTTNTSIPLNTEHVDSSLTYTPTTNTDLEKVEEDNNLSLNLENEQKADVLRPAVEGSNNSDTIVNLCNQSTDVGAKDSTQNYLSDFKESEMDWSSADKMETDSIKSDDSSHKQNLSVGDVNIESSKNIIDEEMSLSNIESENSKTVLDNESEDSAATHKSSEEIDKTEMQRTSAVSPLETPDIISIVKETVTDKLPIVESEDETQMETDDIQDVACSGTQDEEPQSSKSNEDIKSPESPSVDNVSTESIQDLNDEKCDTQKTESTINNQIETIVDIDENAALESNENNNESSTTETCQSEPIEETQSMISDEVHIAEQASDNINSSDEQGESDDKLMDESFMDEDKIEEPSVESCDSTNKLGSEDMVELPTSDTVSSNKNEKLLQTGDPDSISDIRVDEVKLPSSETELAVSSKNDDSLLEICAPDSISDSQNEDPVDMVELPKSDTTVLSEHEDSLLETCSKDSVGDTRNEESVDMVELSDSELTVSSKTEDLPLDTCAPVTMKISNTRNEEPIDMNELPDSELTSSQKTEDLPLETCAPDIVRRSDTRNEEPVDMIELADSESVSSPKAEDLPLETYSPEAMNSDTRIEVPVDMIEPVSSLIIKDSPLDTCPPETVNSNTRNEESVDMIELADSGSASQHKTEDLPLEICAPETMNSDTRNEVPVDIIEPASSPKIEDSPLETCAPETMRSSGTRNEESVDMIELEDSESVSSSKIEDSPFETCAPETVKSSGTSNEEPIDMIELDNSESVSSPKAEDLPLETCSSGSVIDSKNDDPIDVDDLSALEPTDSNKNEDSLVETSVLDTRSESLVSSSQNETCPPDSLSDATNEVSVNKEPQALESRNADMAIRQAVEVQNVDSVNESLNNSSEPTLNEPCALIGSNIEKVIELDKDCESTLPTGEEKETDENLKLPVQIQEAVRDEEIDASLTKTSMDESEKMDTSCLDNSEAGNSDNLKDSTKVDLPRENNSLLEKNDTDSVEKISTLDQPKDQLDKMEVDDEAQKDNGEERLLDQSLEDKEIHDREEKKTESTEVVDIAEDSQMDDSDNNESLEDPILDKSDGTSVKVKDQNNSSEKKEIESNKSTETKAVEEMEVDDNEKSDDCENETITGDTSTRVPEQKKDPNCIIPDDNSDEVCLATRLSKKNAKRRKSSSEQDDSNDGSKGRPRRNAARLADSKIKSLVRNDLVSIVDDVPDDPDVAIDNAVGIVCTTCMKPIGNSKLSKTVKGEVIHFCSAACYDPTEEKSDLTSTNEPQPGDSSLFRGCAHCRNSITGVEKNLSWETMDFCEDQCLEAYQSKLVSNCANCKKTVQASSMGKYCVRFGCDIKQFCRTLCLEEYKKGLKVCSYCQKDISGGSEGFLAPVGDKGQFKDFCTQACMEKYEMMGSNIPRPDVIEKCAVCSEEKPVRVEIQLEDKVQKLCSDLCFAAFKFVNKVSAGQCNMCKKYFDKLNTVNFSIYYDDEPHSFCCKTCMNVYILANRKIVPCSWCKVKKYNFDMIRRIVQNGQVLMVCSLNCLQLYQKRFPKSLLSTPDAVTTPGQVGRPKRILPRLPIITKEAGTPTNTRPVISTIQSLAANGPSRVSLPEISMVTPTSAVLTSTPITLQPPAPPQPPPPPPPPKIYQQILTKPAPVKEMKNKSTICKPYTHTKGVSCRPHPCVKETQTDESLTMKCLIPVPVPIFVPSPMHMFSTPFPVAVPFPLPIPVPVFIPTTRNSAKGIFKEIKKIQEKIPTDPFEAELLMMAEMVAGEKKQDPTDSESEEGEEAPDTTFSPEAVDTSNTFGDDIMQMALTMASELDEPAVDMESVLTPNTITPASQPSVDPSKALYHTDDSDPGPVMAMNRGRKRNHSRGGARSSPAIQSKRGRRSSSSVDVPMLPPPEPVAPPRIEVEKPDANMCLKYTFGVNAWRHWVVQKNTELEKAAVNNRKIKPFKPELLQLTADELNFSLCLFVKEVRKPNGTEYAPDTIYYLCLGIQQYLFENGRIDNIFTDSYYEKFTDCLDDVAKKFAALYNDSQYIVTRVEEEHLWESKQLGAHSPHVLLSTLMFFNTKHFNLTTVEEHMQLSFSHIMKHWKRNPNAPGVAKIPGSRNVLLRFYPPQSALEANSRKKKVYEQQENEENPLRCPVKLYEFYLSKCPESVKTRNDVFYLLPERSCVPDSPVWYSTMALGKEPLMKMLHRVKMVKEINIALLTS